jgi:chromosome partitioning protein
MEQGMATAVETIIPVMVAVFNQKGGVAKTTSACNLAVCLAGHGYRVALVDLDTQGNATNSFGIQPLPSVGAFDVITGEASLEDALIATPYAGLWLLPATTRLRSGEPAMADAACRRGLLESRLAGSGLDLVVVDCPPALAAATGTALASANAVLMPVRPDPFAHEGLVNTWYEIKRIRESVNNRLGIAGILLTMTASEPAGADVARIIRAEFGEQVYGVEIATDPKVSEAAQMAMPISVLDPDGLAGRAYFDATEELLRRLARQNRPGTALRPASGRDEALNTLRTWRSTVHAALLRVPKGKGGWAGRGEAAQDADGDEDDEFHARPPARPVPWGLLTGMAAGLAAGMAAEAYWGMLGKLLR